MKLLSLVTMATLTMATGAEESPKSIGVETLNEISVIGKLGIPLGEVATVRALIVDGDSLGTKADMGSYLLKIVEVNGAELESEPIIGFSLAPGSGVKLANDNFKLYELKTGRKTGELTGEQIEDLKKDYAGRTVFLQVFEVGSFTGLPRKLPEGMLAWQDRAFHFRTDLQILREVEAGPRK